MLEILPEMLFLRGDANGDGVMDMSDISTIYFWLYVEDFPLTCLDAADANDDGVVDQSDLIYIADYLFGDIEQLPAPADAPGLDPSDDDLGCGE